MIDKNPQELYQKITRFVANNQLLDRLDSTLNEFNPIKVMKADQFEIRHSNILAWLLNPKENHYLGDMVLKKIFAEILCGDVIIKNHGLQITDVLLGSFHDADVLREWRNIDIVVISKKNNLVLFIENKVYAGLADHQLQKYLNIIRESYPSIQHVIPVFLTLSGEEAPHSEYYSFSHTDILAILRAILELNQDKMNEKIFDFISYYTKTLEVLTMQDEQLISLCRELYKHHREAIDAIIKYGVVSTSTLNQATDMLKINIAITDHSNHPDFHLSDKEFWFIPTSLKVNMPQIVGSWKSPYPFSYFFAAEEKRLLLILEVGPIKDGQLRVDLMNHIVQNDIGNLFRIKANALTNMNVKFTRLRSKNIEIDDWSDADHVFERMNSLMNQFQFIEVNNVLEGILKGFHLGQVNDKI
ncbi:MULTISPECIES: PD-(D/E)XK nuclease family protein [Paenibacillus]|uniref:PDDEXK-like family protein n=1 Tax=Paenibacillus TaxID=44249 RepID=UPI00096EBB16|nr:PD-(D/E)XK nuclease family protein [Paenibacillus odorifer]OMC98847.1 hypothetical protein BJP46_03755 [Paenibacillus odorifer]